MFQINDLQEIFKDVSESISRKKRKRKMKKIQRKLEERRIKRQKMNSKDKTEIDNALCATSDEKRRLGSFLKRLPGIQLLVFNR